MQRCHVCTDWAGGLACRVAFVIHIVPLCGKRQTQQHRLKALPTFFSPWNRRISAAWSTSCFFQDTKGWFYSRCWNNPSVWYTGWAWCVTPTGEVWFIKTTCEETARQQQICPTCVFYNDFYCTRGQRCRSHYHLPAADGGLSEYVLLLASSSLLPQTTTELKVLCYSSEKKRMIQKSHVLLTLQPSQSRVKGSSPKKEEKQQIKWNELRLVDVCVRACMCVCVRVCVRAKPEISPLLNGIICSDFTTGGHRLNDLMLAC